MEQRRIMLLASGTASTESRANLTGNAPRLPGWLPSSVVWPASNTARCWALGTSRDSARIHATQTSCVPASTMNTHLTCDTRANFTAATTFFCGTNNDYNLWLACERRSKHMSDDRSQTSDQPIFEGGWKGVSDWLTEVRKQCCACRSWWRETPFKFSSAFELLATCDLGTCYFTWQRCHCCTAFCMTSTHISAITPSQAALQLPEPIAGGLSWALDCKRVQGLKKGARLPCHPTAMLTQQQEMPGGSTMSLLSAWRALCQFLFWPDPRSKQGLRSEAHRCNAAPGSSDIAEGRCKGWDDVIAVTQQCHIDQRALQRPWVADRVFSPVPDGGKSDDAILHKHHTLPA